MTFWVCRGFKQDSGKRVSLFIVLREYHLMKGPDKEAIFSFMCSSDILEQHDINNRRGRVGKGIGHLAHVWSYGVREVVSSNPDRGNIVGWVFHPTRWLARFSLIWKCLSFQILKSFRTLSSWGSDNYRPSAPLLYEVASHVKQLPFRPILLLLWHIVTYFQSLVFTNNLT